MNDLRLELRTRNNRLWHAIHDTHKNVAAFCKIHGLSQSEVGVLLNLKSSPYLSHRDRVDIRNRKPIKKGSAGDLSALAYRLVIITGIEASELFPWELYDASVPRTIIAEVDSRRFVGLAAAHRLALPPAQDEQIAQSEARDAINVALSTLTPREATVIRQRFGLAGEEERDLEDIGVGLNVSRERIRQIEAKALRKLRHPSRSRRLREKLESLDVTT